MDFPLGTILILSLLVVGLLKTIELMERRQKSLTIDDKSLQEQLAIALIILSFLLFCWLLAHPSPSGSGNRCSGYKSASFSNCQRK